MHRGQERPRSAALILLFCSCSASDAASPSVSDMAPLLGRVTKELPAIGQLYLAYDTSEAVDCTTTGACTARYCTGTLLEPAIVGTTAYCLVNYTGEVSFQNLGMGDGRPKRGHFTIDYDDGYVRVPLSRVQSTLTQADLERAKSRFESVRHEASEDANHSVWSEQRAFLARDQGAALLTKAVPPELAQPLQLVSEHDGAPTSEFVTAYGYGVTGNRCRPNALQRLVDSLCDEAFVMAGRARAVAADTKRKVELRVANLTKEAGGAPPRGVFCPGDAGAPLVAEVGGVARILALHSASSGPPFFYDYSADPARVPALTQIAEALRAASGAQPPVVSRDTSLAVGDDRVAGADAELRLVSNDSDVRSFIVVEFSFVGLAHVFARKVTLRLRRLDLAPLPFAVRLSGFPDNVFETDGENRPCARARFCEDRLSASKVTWSEVDRQTVDGVIVPFLGDLQTAREPEWLEIDITAYANRVLSAGRRLTLLAYAGPEGGRGSARRAIALASKEHPRADCAPELVLEGVVTKERPERAAF